MSEQLDAELRSSSGFISAKDYTADDGEIITVVRFETDDDLMRWRDDGQHGANQKFVGDYYESFWVQTGTVHREYVWRDGKRIAGHGSWPFGRTTA